MLDRFETLTLENPKKVVTILLLTLSILAFFIFEDLLNEVLILVSNLFKLLITGKGSSSDAEHFYYVVNVVSPVLLIILTLFSVIGIVKTIRDNTKQRKLEGMDKLINISVAELKVILDSTVYPPPIIAEILGDDYSKKTNQWDIRKVVTQVSAFIDIADSIPNKRLSESVRMFVTSPDFHYNSFDASVVVLNQYISLLELILMRQKVEKDKHYNEVILNCCEYLYPFLDWVYGSNDEQLGALSESIDKIQFPKESFFSLKDGLSYQMNVKKFDSSYGKYDGLSCIEILSHNHSMEKVIEPKSFFRRKRSI